MPIPAEILIHIGYHKTGTTWLQHQLFNHGQRGYCSLAPRDHRGGNPAKSLARRFLDVQVLQFDAEAVGQKILSDVDWPEDSAGLPVISSERLSGSPYAGGVDAKDIAERLQAVLPSAKILIVLREQRSMVLSCYYQFLRDGGFASLETFLTARDNRLPGFRVENFRYHHLIRHYRKCFGDDRVLALPYELFLREPADFVGRLASHTGVAVAPDLPFDTKANAGDSRYARSKLRVLNLFAQRSSLNGYSPLAIPKADWLIRQLERGLDRIVPAGRREALIDAQKQRVAAACEGQFGESNRSSSELIGIDLQGFGYELAAK